MYEKEETKQSKEETSYQLGAGIEAFQRNSKTFYYHQDEQLNTALITNGNREIKNQYQYDAFGNGLETIEELPNRIRYTGQQYDQQTEQYYLRARYLLLFVTYTASGFDIISCSNKSFNLP